MYIRILLKKGFVKTKIYIALFSFFLSVSFSSQAQTGEVTISQDTLIPHLLDMKTQMAKANRLGDRYMIQIYSGNSSGATEAIENYRETFQEWPSTIVFETPNYKVWIGNFRNNLEADRALLIIRESFPTAFRFKPTRR